MMENDRSDLSDSSTCQLHCSSHYKPHKHKQSKLSDNICARVVRVGGNSVSLCACEWHLISCSEQPQDDVSPEHTLSVDTAAEDV